MREQPKVWCDTKCGAQVGPYPTALAAEVAAEKHEGVCGACAELKNPPMSTPAAPEPRVGDTWEYRTDHPDYEGLNGDIRKIVSISSNGYIQGLNKNGHTRGLSVKFLLEHARLVSRAADDEPAPKKNPAPAVGQRRQWENEPYTITGLDPRDSGRMVMRFDCDPIDSKPCSYAIASLANDRYLGQAAACSVCSGWLRPGEVHLKCERSRKPTPVAGTPVPTVFVPGRGYVPMAPRKPAGEKREVLEAKIRLREPGPSAVAKAPGARDWMMGLCDEYDLLPDA